MIATATISVTGETPKQALKLPPWQSLHKFRVQNLSENDCTVSLDRGRWDTVPAGQTAEFPIGGMFAAERCDDGGVTVRPGACVWIKPARYDKPVTGVVITLF